MLDEHVELLERAFVEQKLDALARGQLATRVLRLDPLSPPPSFAPARRASRVSRMSFMMRSRPIYPGSNTAFCGRETRRSRVPDALQRSSRCCAEPGPYQTPRFVRPRLSSAPP
jgi:hypothetical protein